MSPRNEKLLQHPLLLSNRRPALLFAQKKKRKKSKKKKKKKEEKHTPHSVSKVCGERRDEKVNHLGE